MRLVLDYLPRFREHPGAGTSRNACRGPPAKPSDSQHSEGRTVSPETKGEAQPQGRQ